MLKIKLMKVWHKDSVLFDRYNINNYSNPSYVSSADVKLTFRLP